MIMRALDSNGDWTFGKGRNNYLRRTDALAQSISTRLNSFVNDCFFDLQAGVDWFTFLGGKNLVTLKLAISSVILNTPNVTALKELNISTDANRKLTVQYSVTTAFSAVSSVANVNATVSLIVNGLTL